MAAISEQTNLRVLSPKRIVSLSEERRRRYKGRDDAYEVYQRYYRGRQKMPGPSVMASNSQGRPLLRVIGESAGGDKQYTSQRLAPIIDDSQALLGRMPA